MDSAPRRLARPLAGASDERLAELLRGGSEPAFEALVARHRRSMVRECTRLLGPGDAEEAVQEALLRAHLRLAAGGVVHAPGPWLRATARHTAINMLRARAARPVLADAEVERVAGEATAADSPDRRSQLTELVGAVAALPERQRHAIVMRELEGRSYEEIGQRLGASHGAVRQLLNRARSSLRARLGMVAGLEPVLRLAIGGGAGAGAVRLGALSGCCALTIKLGSGLLAPATLPVLATAAPRQVLAAPRVTVRPAPAALSVTAGAPARRLLVAAPARPPLVATPRDRRSFIAGPVRRLVIATPSRRVAPRHPFAESPTHVRSDPTR